jgi:hypothetical protein
MNGINGIKLAEGIFLAALVFAALGITLYIAAKVRGRKNAAEDDADLAAATEYFEKINPRRLETYLQDTPLVVDSAQTEVFPALVSDAPKPGSAILDIQNTARIAAVIPPTGALKVKTPQPVRFTSPAVKASGDWTPADTDAWIADMRYRTELHTLSLIGGELAPQNDGPGTPLGGTWIS